MTKMHLKARPANEGARRLAWWIGREFAGSVGMAAWRLRIGEATVEWLLAGEIAPGTELVTPLGEVAGVPQRLWSRAPEGGWFDAPLPLDAGTLGRRLAA